MDRELAHYIVEHYRGLMTKDENKAYRILGAALKATHGLSSDVPAQEEASRRYPGMPAVDSQILQLSHDGWEPFVERTAQRILVDNRQTVFLNYCPRCNRLARTPKTPVSIL